MPCKKSANFLTKISQSSFEKSRIVLLFADVQGIHVGSPGGPRSLPGEGNQLCGTNTITKCVGAKRDHGQKQEVEARREFLRNSVGKLTHVD